MKTDIETEDKNETKKQRKFFAKEFRQKIKTIDGLESLKEFVQLYESENSNQHYASEFIGSGGSLSELLQFVDLLDKKNVSQVLPVFQSFNIVLLTFMSINEPENLSNCEESCRECLVKHYTIIKAMLSLNSTSKQRKVALKLLSTMVTISPTVAKDVLALMSFDSSILEVLTNPGDSSESRSVRTAFIHFLLSFLIDGNSTTITTFLEKRGLLSSIFQGLIYDKSDTIELILTTVQKQVVEDKYLSKTLKMQTFNTHVVKNLVNLYNWKGPDVGKKTGNFKKRMMVKKIVDPVLKQLVTECVHRFLLVLCTSKYGVIFRDPTVGLSGKVHNSLMLTVLQGLEKPWDHVNASELVVKICVVCPDLVKSILNDVIPFLKPRDSQKWLNAIRFVRKLIGSLEVENVSQYFDKLTIKKVGLIIQAMCIPHNLIQIINKENLLNDNIGIRHEIIELLNTICDSVYKYLKHINNSKTFTLEQKNTLKTMTVNYLEQNLPSLELIISVWKTSTTTTTTTTTEHIEIPEPDMNEHRKTILDILYNYHLICPNLLQDITHEIDALNFLQTFTNETVTIDMYVKAINLFLICDYSSFLPTKPLYEFTFPLLIKAYVDNSNRDEVEKTLLNIIKNTGVFDGAEHEIFIWLYSILECSNYDENIGKLLTFALKLTYENYSEYCKEITIVKESVSEENFVDFKSIIESLSVEVYENKNVEKIVHLILSPFIVGVLRSGINVTEYSNIALVHLLHSQTSSKILTELIIKENNIDKNVLKYYKNWSDCNSLTSLKNIYNNITIVTKFCKYIISDGKTIDLENIEKHHVNILTRMLTFYLTQMAKNEILTESHMDKYSNITIILLNKSKEYDFYENFLSIILKNPYLIQVFSPLRTDNIINKLCTYYVSDVIKQITENKSEIESYVSSYRTILLRRLHVSLTKNKKHKKPPKNNNFMKITTLLELSSENCNELLKSISEMPVECYISTENTPSAIVELLEYILHQNIALYKENKHKPFDLNDLKNITEQLSNLNTYKIELNLEKIEETIYENIKTFPHIVGIFNDEYYKGLLLKSTTKSSGKLAMIVLKHNKCLFRVVQSNIDSIDEKRELIFSILSSIIDDKVDDFTEKIYKKHEPIILKMINKPQKTAQYLIENYETISKLIERHMSLETCYEFGKKSHKFECTEVFHMKLLKIIYDKCIQNQEDKTLYINNYITTNVNLITNILKKSDINDIDTTTFNDYLKSITNFKINFNENVTIQLFSKLCLKHGLQGNGDLIKLLNTICDFANDDDEYISTLFEMAVSHSESLNILLDNTTGIKPQLLNLLLTLCMKNKTVISKNHIPVWLGAYQGTVSASDRCLLRLMQLYEEANVGFHEYKPYLWGTAAIGHYSVRFGIETSLWRQPKAVEVLDIFDIDKVMTTITYFPRMRMLNQEEDHNRLENSNVYDPAFYLPLFSQLLAPESAIRWYQCKSNAIALVIVALTSEVNDIRTAACHVLARFHNHLEAARYGKDRLLWIHFIEALCRSASTMDNLQLSSIAGIFMARCALIFNRPDHTLYTALTNYIMAKHHPDLNYVPEMLELLHSTDVKHIEHRNFILEVMRDGLKSDYDLKVMLRSMAFKLLMDMSSSSVMNYEGKKLILEVISKAVVLQMGSKVLVENQGLLSWLFGVIKLFTHYEGELVMIVINLMDNLINSLEEKKLVDIHFNLILCMIMIIDAFKRVKIIYKEDLLKFINILYKMYSIHSKFLTKSHLMDLLSTCTKHFDCKTCYYYIEYGSEYVDMSSISDSLHLLTLKWINTNKEKV